MTILINSAKSRGNWIDIILILITVAALSLAILKISRTIADLAGEELINAEHLKEAVGYRRDL